MIVIILTLVALIVAAADLTDPFSRRTIVRQPYVIAVEKDGFKVVNENHKLILRQDLGWLGFAYAKRFLHLLRSRYVHSPGSSAADLDGIIRDIHAYRFRPDRLLLTSGDHFGDLFVRNLGVFYYPMLDIRTPSTEQDWENRQIVYLQTLAYALGVFEKRPIPVTTIVPTGAYAATCINLYAYPPDTVYALLYALAALLGDEPATPDAGLCKPLHTLQTKTIAKQLTKQYHATLQQLYAHYLENVLDPDTGLVRTDRHFSGAKDITRRCSAFYDNVILWKTMELAARLDVAPDDPQAREALKQRIIRTFWVEDRGHFLEDISPESIAGNYYSSDWLIVLVTGFLSPRVAAERVYFERSVDYIQEHKIDQPFGLKYQQERRAHRQFFLVRITVASYGGDAIWSFWGMEYIKCLLLLYNETKEPSYLATADEQLKAYKQVMLRDRGFPEVYDPHGALLETLVYRSIRQTGWVIGFEQARAMRDAVTASSKDAHDL